MCGVVHNGSLTVHWVHKHGFANVKIEDVQALRAEHRAALKALHARRTKVHQDVTGHSLSESQSASGGEEEKKLEEEDEEDETQDQTEEGIENDVKAENGRVGGVKRRKIARG